MRTFFTTIDGDAASNTLGWRWVAGLHTKGKMYLADETIFANILMGVLIRRTYANITIRCELAVHSTLPLSTPDQIPAREFILLITEDDCLGGLDILKNKISGAISYAAPALRSPLKVSDKVKTSRQRLF